MSDMIVFLCFLFAKIDDKKISGSQSAGYRMNHFVEKGIFFLAFWIQS